MIIERSITKTIRKLWSTKPKVVILYGPRQSGKTTLVTRLLLRDIDPKSVAAYNGDDLRDREAMGKPDLAALKKAVGNKKYLFVDEAQRIPDIGLTLKLLYDSLKIRIIASGSSSFDLASRVSEPLTGRSATVHLYPLSLAEIPSGPSGKGFPDGLEELLRYGAYPAVATAGSNEEKERYLYDLVNTYLHKDILSFESVRKPQKVVDLLALLALQVGSEVSTAELAKHLALSKVVVEKYLDILEKMFVIVRLRGLSRNLRKEIYKSSKYYFVDTGLRNALIRNFNPLNLRSDAGAMFENFILIERMKALNNAGEFGNFYFWRTYDQKEIDIIEERGGKLRGYEVKWGQGKVKSPKEFLEAYNGATFEVITKENYRDFIS
jgi:hypothetical protein